MSVFDSSAVLAIFYGEEGRDVARRHLSAASISRVNVAEVLGDIIKSGKGTVEDGWELLNDLGLRCRSIYDDHLDRVAELGRVKGLSLGDRFCIALAETIHEPLVTSDQQWATLDLAVPVHLIR